MTQMEKVTSTRPSIARHMRPDLPTVKTTSLEGFKIPPGISVPNILHLSPGRPRVGESHLTFLSAVLVESEEGQEFAVFNSAYAPVQFPGVDVNFVPLKTGKSHLVEFHVQVGGNGMTYKFRKFFGYDYEDISDDATNLISVLVPPVPNYISTCYAAISQLNASSEDAGWLLWYVRITAVN